MSASRQSLTYLEDLDDDDIALGPHLGPKRRPFIKSRPFIK